MIGRTTPTADRQEYRRRGILHHATPRRGLHRTCAPAGERPPTERLRLSGRMGPERRPGSLRAPDRDQGVPSSGTPTGSDADSG